LAYQRFFKKKPKQVTKFPKEPSLSSLKAKLQKVFNAYIRKRDTINGTFFICISCNKPKPLDQMHAGHYFAAGHNEAIRFDEFNVGGQCVACNHFLHGNFEGYTKGMLKRYGQKTIDLLEIRRHNLSKLTKFEINMLIDIYTKKLKQS